MKIRKTKMKGKLVLVVMALWAGMSVFGVPARQGAVIRTTADGTSKTVYLHGDAFNHYITDAEGRWLNEKSLLPMSESEKSAYIHEAAEREQARRAQARRMPPARIGGQPNIAPRGLMIMVNFKDCEFTTERETIDSLLNGKDYSREYSYDYQQEEDGPVYTDHVVASGSARKYFEDQSFGAYSPVFDVVGPYTLKFNTAHYGSNKDALVGAMIKEACEMADADGADFTLYDNNNDGKVDFVYVLYAGYGEADGGGEETIWPHNWDLSSAGAMCTVDGKAIRNYACSNEMNGYSHVYNGIGTFVHEFGHVLGLPDLYVINNTSQNIHTLWEWDIMDYGPYNNDSNTPPAYSAYERFYMGWLTPRILTDPERVTLQPMNDSQEALMIVEGDTHNLDGVAPNPAVFYLLENRQLTGWDTHLPGPGMLITKISHNPTNWKNNRVNNNLNAIGVDLLEAQPNDTKYALPPDAYPAGSDAWTGLEDHEVTDITMTADGLIRFSYRGAGEGTTAEETVRPGSTPAKVLRNGQLFILRDGKTYTVHGQEIR